MVVSSGANQIKKNTALFFMVITMPQYRAVSEIFL